MMRAINGGLHADDRPIVISGVAGFIGHHTAAQLLDLGFTVVGIDSFVPYYDRAIKQLNLDRIGGRERFTFHEASISSPTCRRLLDGARAVIHLAAQPGVRDSWHDFDTYVDLNVRATKTLLDAAIDAGVERVVCASSSSVYGDAAAYPTTEATLTKPRSPYGMTKLAAERLAVAYALERGLPTVSLRYFTVYGPAQRPDMAIQRMITAARTGGAFPLMGDGRQIRDFTYIDDVVRANVLAAVVPDVEPGEVLNVCGGSPVSVAELIDTVERVTGCSLSIEHRGAVAGDVQRTGGSAERIERVLGWKPEVSLGEGIRLHNEEVVRRLELDYARASGDGLSGARSATSSRRTGAQVVYDRAVARFSRA